MGFMERELDRISTALRAETDPERHRQLYAAQQALSWAQEPNGFRTPFDLVMGTPAGSTDCPECPCPLPS